jgi:midasin
VQFDPQLTATTVSRCSFPSPTVVLLTAVPAFSRPATPRGRFLELHVEELPDSELADILHQRCGIAPSYASKMVTVLRELQRRRQRSNVFAGRHGFITPRDLFRWAERGAVGYEALAVDGFCVLGERLRSGEERALVVEVLQSVLRVTLDMEQVGVESVMELVLMRGVRVWMDG